MRARSARSFGAASVAIEDGPGATGVGAAAGADCAIRALAANASMRRPLETDARRTDLRREELTCALTSL